MTTATKQYTNEEIRVNFRAAQKRVEPAILNNSFEGRTHNEVRITQRILAEKREPTADNFYHVINQLVEDLMWTVEPAKLAAIKANKRPAIVESTIKLNEQRAKIVKDAEIADAYAKEQTEFEALAYAHVDSFMPMNKRGSIDYRKMGDVQTQLKEHIKKEKARGCRMKEVHAAVAEHLKKEYSAIERASEYL